MRVRVAGISPADSTGFESGSALLEVDGEVWQLPLNDIAVARLVPA